MSLIEANYGADLTGKAEPTPTQTTNNTDPTVRFEYLDNDGTMVRFHSPYLEGFILGASTVSVFEIVPSKEHEGVQESKPLFEHEFDFLRARELVVRVAEIRSHRRNPDNHQLGIAS